MELKGGQFMKQHGLYPHDVKKLGNMAGEAIVTHNTINIHRSSFANLNE